MTRLDHATPRELGLDEERLEVAYRRLDAWTRVPDVPGEVPPVPGGMILVGRRGRVVAPRFFGRQGPEPDAGPLRPDSLFYLASITKPLTYMTALRLVERGELCLSDLVMRHIPEFAAQHKEETKVAHLFTHTSGMPDMLPDNTELRRAQAPLSRFVEGALAAVPLFPPGTQLSYQSMGTLVVAELVQRFTGRPIRDAIREELLAPLGLEQIALGSRGFDRERLVRVQLPDEPGIEDYGWNSRYWQELGAPWGGMFATPEDFAVICQMLLDEGRRGDVRILSRATVRLMTTNRLDDFPALPEADRRTRPWGLGWMLNHRGSSGTLGDLLSPRAFGHTGSTGNLCWIDPERDGFCLLFTSAIRARAPWRLVELSNIVASAFG